MNHTSQGCGALSQSYSASIPEPTSSPCQQACLTLESARAELAVAIDQLHSRLIPVLADNNVRAMDETKAIESPTMSEMHGHLLSAVRSTRASTRCIIDLMDRLTI